MRYKLPVRELAASAALTLATLPGLVAAQDAPEKASDNCYSDEFIVTAGGIRVAGEALWIDTEVEKHLSDNITLSLLFSGDIRRIRFSLAVPLILLSGQH